MTSNILNSRQTFFIPFIKKTNKSETQLELCAATKCVRHDDIFIEVVGVRIAVSFDFVNNLVDRDDWCLFSILLGKFWRWLVKKNIIWEEEKATKRS